MYMPSMAPGSGSTRSLSHLFAVVYRLMPRRLRARMESAPMLLLTTIGNDSGEPQTVALGYFKDGPNLVVVGSNYGSDQHSIWYLNLRAHPHVEVQIEEALQKMVASTATPAERAHLFRRLVSENRQYGRYQRDTTREIPIVLLHPAAPMLTAPVRR